MSFRRKEISSQPRLGERLVSKRSEIGQSLQEAARGCGIQAGYLKALETGDYDSLPGEVYAKSFLKNYAQYLSLNPHVLVAQYCNERTIYQNIGKAAAEKYHHPVAKISRAHLLVMPKIFRSFAIILLAAIVVTYLGLKVQAIIAPPRLQLLTPATDFVTSESVVTVSGSVPSGAILTVNGQQVVADEQGYFSEDVDLKFGINTIEVRAKKKHSQEAIITRQVVVVDE